jgi:coiled-coil domain-containing protein 55
VQDIYAAALEEDPNAFEYDSLYDSMQEQKAVPKQQERLTRKPKYIASLLEQAEVRKKEQGITYERQLVRT